MANGQLGLREVDGGVGRAAGEESVAGGRRSGWSVVRWMSGWER